LTLASASAAMGGRVRIATRSVTQLRRLTMVERPVMLLRLQWHPGEEEGLCKRRWRSTLVYGARLERRVLRVLKDASLALAPGLA
jgi:hypothetical protein